MIKAPAGDMARSKETGCNRQHPVSNHLIESLMKILKAFNPYSLA